MDNIQPAFSVQTLDFYYGASKALSNINLEIETRKVTALIRRKGEQAKRGIARIVERGAGIGERGAMLGEEALETDHRPSIPGKDPKIRIKRGPAFP